MTEPRKGRPPLPDARHETLRVRLRAEEKALVEERARALGLSPSEYARRLLLAE